VRRADQTRTVATERRFLEQSALVAAERRHLSAAGCIPEPEGVDRLGEDARALGPERDAVDRVLMAPEHGNALLRRDIPQSALVLRGARARRIRVDRDLRIERAVVATSYLNVATLAPLWLSQMPAVPSSEPVCCSFRVTGVESSR
jgi:hypothetical protein